MRTALILLTSVLLSGSFCSAQALSARVPADALIYIGGPRPHAALLCKAGADAKAMQDQINSLIQNQPAPFPINTALDGDLLVLSLGYDKPEDALAGAAGAQSLANSGNFKKALSQAGS